MSRPHPSASRLEIRALPIAESTTGALVLCDDSGIVRFASEGVREILGRSPQELTGRAIRSLACDLGLSGATLDALARTLASGESSRLELRLGNGDSAHDVEVGVQELPARPGQGREYVAVLADVTERRRAERALEQSEHRYRALVEASPDPIVVHARGLIRYVNPAALVLLGAQAPQELIGRPIMEFVHPEFHGLVRERVRKMEETGEPGTMLAEKLLRLDATTIEVEVAGAPVVYEGEPAIQLVGRDATERRRAERERQRLAERRRDVERRESLATLAAGVAHSLATLAGSIVDAADREIELGAHEHETRTLVAMRGTGLRLSALAEQLRACAGASRARLRRLSLPQLVLECSERIEAETPPGVSLGYDLPGDTRPVRVDAALVQRVLLDLVRNAVEAMRGAPGGIQIGARRIDLDAATTAELEPPGALEPGPCMALEVRDDGCGMDTETRRRILDPFFSTKAAGRGLGLAEVFGLVRAQGGALQVESAPGRGTTVRVIFPLGDEERPSRR